MSGTVRRAPRICILAESFYPLGGGVGTYGLALARELIAQGATVEVVTQRQRDDLPRMETVDGVRIVRLPVAGPGRLGKYLMLWPGFRHLSRTRDSYDIIYVWGLRVLGVLGVLAAKRLGKRCIVRAEQTGEMSGEFIYQQMADGKWQIEKGHATSHQPSAKQRVLRPLFQRMVSARNRILRRADRFVAISDALRAEFQSCEVPAQRIDSIPNGVDPERFRPLSPEARAAVRRELGIGGEYLFVFAGRLHQHKGLFHLLDAWSLLAPAPDARLLLVGGNSPVLGCEQALKDLVRTRGQQDAVTFIGPVSSVLPYLQAADCFVLPSEREGFSIALLEAMACGLPSVATMTSGTPELIRSGETGELVAIGDPGALAQAMDRMRKSPGRGVVMGQTARELVNRDYSIATAAARHLELFGRLQGPTASSVASAGPEGRTAAHSPGRTAW